MTRARRESEEETFTGRALNRNDVCTVVVVVVVISNASQVSICADDALDGHVGICSFFICRAAAAAARTTVGACS